MGFNPSRSVPLQEADSTSLELEEGDNKVAVSWFQLWLVPLSLAWGRGVSCVCVCHVMSRTHTANKSNTYSTLFWCGCIGRQMTH